MFICTISLPTPSWYDFPFPLASDELFHHAVKLANYSTNETIWEKIYSNSVSLKRFIFPFSVVAMPFTFGHNACELNCVGTGVIIT